MLLKIDTLTCIKCNEVSLASRQWRRPTVKSDGRPHTTGGELRIDEVRPVTSRALTSVDAAAARFESRQALLGRLCDGGGDICRVALVLDQLDQRHALREEDRRREAELASVVTRLRHMDTRSADGTWTERVLSLIDTQPYIPVRLLAAELDCEWDRLKPNVRKLKNLGLTISHGTAYSLSARGRAVLAELKATRPA